MLGWPGGCELTTSRRPDAYPPGCVWAPVFSPVLHTRPDHAREVRQALSSPRRLCAALGLDDGAKPQVGDGLLICCPVHADRTPSCSVTLGPDGTIRVRCFGCDFSADALGLIRVVRGCGDFRETLAVGAELAGALQLRDEILGGDVLTERPRFIPAKTSAPTEYPEGAAELWAACSPVAADADAWDCLRARGIDPDAVDALGLARTIGEAVALPHWARYQGRSWRETGHRLVLPTWDHLGRLQSVRAWRVWDDDASPKRLPPAGCRAAGLVVANRLGWAMLAGMASPMRLVIAEGEPDFLSVAVSTGDAVLGVVSGSWGWEMAERIPNRTRVVVATHNDVAGDAYAEHIIQTVVQRCAVWRTVPDVVDAAEVSASAEVAA